MNNLSREDFLKLSALGMAAIPLLGMNVVEHVKTIFK